MRNNFSAGYHAVSSAYLLKKSTSILASSCILPFSFLSVSLILLHLLLFTVTLERHFLFMYFALRTYLTNAPGSFFSRTLRASAQRCAPRLFKGILYLTSFFPSFFHLFFSNDANYDLNMYACSMLLYLFIGHPSTLLLWFDFFFSSSLRFIHSPCHCSRGPRVIYFTHTHECR